MEQELEIEFKNILTQQEYQQLYTDFKQDKYVEFSQRNVYFDTPSLDLKDRGCALRIRIKEDQAEMTLKTPFEGHHKELNLPLSLDDAHLMTIQGAFQIPEPVIEILESEDSLLSRSVIKLAELETSRLETMKDDTLVVLDKSTYSGKVDYELEVEAASEEVGLKMFESILETYAIPKRKTENKIARAFNAGKKRS
ncbi:CYTH domain-containing protein [Alkalibacterium pelagium]|uniref:Uncharacterized protein YjbK n=1 Tax=Alkalibacterium pelagium TaxID=426702 RepID=A0A1H7NES4_9LACT|nr:CYTH domain-containing protein [Alkalibacterium pelagium]GEN51347.1 putative triphosphatase YjbK [Alkalibacterium pelagium]SEL22003.1 Uncharacterized protein YjbK [Alkalibacterium pelagium]